MLHFFRRIRQKLITDGHLSKYLIYALGEILLVVAGILIALQINNWNQNNNNEKLETTYLERLKKDLRKDSSRMNAHMHLLEVKADILQSLLKEQLDSIDYIANVRNPYSIFATRSIHTANLNTATFDDLISTGNIANIKDIELRDSIITYYTVTKRHEKILSNKLSDWSQRISELIPGEMGLYARSGQKKPTTEQINHLKENLRMNLTELKPSINAELNHTGLQYDYNKSTQDYNKQLLTIIDEKLSERF